MKFGHAIPSIRVSFEPSVYFLFAAGAVLLALLVVTNPLAVAIPLGGSLATVALLWSVDRLHDAVPEHSDERK